MHFTSLRALTVPLGPVFIIFVQKLGVFYYVLFSTNTSNFLAYKQSYMVTLSKICHYVKLSNC